MNGKRQTSEGYQLDLFEDWMKPFATVHAVMAEPNLRHTRSSKRLRRLKDNEPWRCNAKTIEEAAVVPSRYARWCEWGRGAIPPSTRLRKHERTGGAP